MDDLNQELVERAKDGDEVAIESLVVRHLPALHAFVRCRAGNALAGQESCADLVQSVCRDVLEHVGDYKYRGETAFKNWLFTAAANKLVDRHRFYHRECRDVAREVSVAGSDATNAEQRLLDCYATLGTPSRALARQEELSRIEAAIDALPEHYREVIALSRFVGLSYAEIGEQTGRSETSVRGMVARGLAKLTEVLARG